MGALGFLRAPGRSEVSAYYRTGRVDLVVRAQIAFNEAMEVLGGEEVSLRGALEVGH